MINAQFIILIQQGHRLAHVQDAGDLIDFTFMHEQLVVITGRQLMLDLLNRHREIQGFDLRAVGLLAAGARLRYVLAMAPLGILGFVVLVVTSPYRVNRIIAFLDPYKDPQGIGYHIIHSMEAISGGGLVGRGLGNSELKFGYLPEATTDFIYSIVAEELGITGSALIVGLYVLLIGCGAAIVTACVRGAGQGGPASHDGTQVVAAGTRDGEPLLSNFSQLLGMGFVATVGIQALINVCVVTGLAPTKGIALPLMSRGGTGWILTCLSLGMLVAMERASDRRRRELGVPVPGEGEIPFAERPAAASVPPAMQS